MHYQNLGEHGCTVFSSKPVILCCDLELAPEETKQRKIISLKFFVVENFNLKFVNFSFLLGSFTGGRYSAFV